MYFDLNVPIAFVTPSAISSSKKGKGKQNGASTSQQEVSFSPAQVAKLESRIDLLVRLGYTVLALNQVVESKIDPKTHVNVLEPLLPLLKKRQGILLLKRLTIVLDEASEKGFGLTTSTASIFSPYDILALQPTTQATFSSACLTHTLPSTLTTHVLSIPLTNPRPPYHLKHTLVRTALKNGAVFEINYSGALQGDDERRNWWACARDVVRVTKGKGVLVSGGIVNEADFRAPRDVSNLITLLGLAQDAAHDASSTTAKSLVLRAQTRKTYRAIISEPTIIMPETQHSQNNETQTKQTSSESNLEKADGQGVETNLYIAQEEFQSVANGNVTETSTPNSYERKRPNDDNMDSSPDVPNEGSKKRKRKKKDKVSVS